VPSNAVANKTRSTRRRATNEAKVPETQEPIHPYDRRFDGKGKTQAPPQGLPACVTDAHLLLTVCVISRSNNRHFKPHGQNLYSLGVAGTWNNFPYQSFECEPDYEIERKIIDMTRSGRSSLGLAIPQHMAGG
jgi:hypothetical protein